MSAKSLLYRVLLCCVAVQTSSCAGRADDALAAEVAIPFLTTRGVEILGDRSVDYSTDMAELSAGQCQVTLRRDDELEARNGDIRARPPTAVMESFATRADRGILVYVHGYNVGLERACRDAARLAYATEFADRTLLFSWPASRRLVTYRKDEQRLTASIPAIIAALHELGLRYGYDKVNIVAHSMGSRVALALDDPSVLPGLPDAARFANLILIAPDIDRDRFMSAASGIKNRVRNMSILISEDDKLLLLSQIVNQDERLGLASDLRMEEIEVIDVSDIDDLGLTGHIYHLENTRVGELLRRMLAQSAVD